MCLVFETNFAHGVNRAGIWRLDASDEVSVYGAIFAEQILFSAFILPFSYSL
jgi:hypothetical protein